MSCSASALFPGTRFEGEGADRTLVISAVAGAGRRCVVVVRWPAFGGG
jgi:hypothetical protein